MKGRKNMHNTCALTRWQAQTTFSKLLAQMWGTKRHPGECWRFPLNPALTHTLKSEISAHQRGQYGHRHTGGEGGAEQNSGWCQNHFLVTRDSAQIFGTSPQKLSCVFGLCVWRTWTCTITIGVILLVYGLAGALSVSILLSVELILSRVLLCWSCKTCDTTTG